MNATEGIELGAVPADVAARFWEKTMPEPMSGCTLWLGSMNTGGYGNFWCEGRSRKSHRVAYAIQHGALERGVDVMHKCDNPTCVNPLHLRAVPTALNIRDAFQKGRLHRRGNKNSRTKIPDEMVPIIQRLASVGVTTEQMSFAFGVDGTTIRRCVTGWRKTA